MIFDIMLFLRDGVTLCMDIFSTITVATDTWKVILTCFIIVCIGSLVSPFIFHIGSGFSDKIQNSKAVDKYGNSRRLSNDEKWLM